MKVIIPKETNNDDSVLITKLHARDGDYVEEGEPLLEFETSKTSVLLESPSSGTVSFFVSEDEEVSVNSVACQIGESGRQATEQLSAPSVKDTFDSTVKEAAAHSLVSTANESSATPTRRYSEAAKLKSFNDSELEGVYWVTSRSSQNFLTAGSRDFSERKKTGAIGGKEIKPLGESISRRKKAEIQALGENGGGVFQSTLGIGIEGGVRRVPALLFQESIQDLICYEASRLLAGQFNDLNSFFYDGELHKAVSVSAGISLDDGGRLTVASIPESSNRTLADIQKCISELLIKFEDRNLTTADISPSSFTISDLSSRNITYIRPLLNGREAIIIGVAKGISSGFHLYITFDHRVTEGLRVSALLEELKVRIESYFIDSSKRSCACFVCQKKLDEELKLGRRGMLKVQTERGEKTICNQCFKGW